MSLRCTQRKKNGKEHRYWSIVENRRLPDGRCSGQLRSPAPPAWWR